ncbi:MAG TPA: rRNA adenine N(6)-methyltransferase family protein [Chloroflexota bacterium]|nr:rRNA adenine N(6)-methyltransferase family protein [Chloroflexota bacterium]
MFRAALSSLPPRPLRRRIALSQNFLHDPRTIETSLDRSTVGPDDVVYEIGPGGGAITNRLSLRCRHVVAVEKDAQLAERLRRRFSGRPNVTVFLDDFLTFPLPVTRYKVFSNVPFAVTAGIVTRLTEANNPPEDAYLAVQREAAQRFCGGPRETLVSLLLKPRFEPSVVHRFSRKDFTPEPGVDVVLLRVRKRDPPLLTPAEAQDYGDFVTFGFTAWQPTVARAYAGVLEHHHTVDLSLCVKPADLPFTEWLRLFRRFAEVASPAGRALVRGAGARLRAQQGALQKEHRTRLVRSGS